MYRKIDEKTGINYMITSECGKLLIIWDGTDAAGNYKKQYKAVKVNKKSGVAWKLNKSSVSCDSGQACDLVKLFDVYPAFAAVTFRHFAGL